jgi:hypothetical protein
MRHRRLADLCRPLLCALCLLAAPPAGAGGRDFGLIVFDMSGYAAAE